MKQQPSKIPVRLTRTQRLAFEKKTIKPSTSTTKPNPNRPQRQTQPSRIRPNPSRKTSHETPTTHTTKITHSIQVDQSKVEHMMEDLAIILSTAHYCKVEREYMKLDSTRTHNATSVYTIPVASEEGREDWITQQLIQYPLTMEDMIVRGAFLPEIESSFPSIELFRKTYMSKPLSPQHHQTTLWNARGNPFPYSKWINVKWSKIQLSYTPERIKHAIHAYMQNKKTWYFHFWGKYGAELKQYGYRDDYDPSIQQTYLSQQ